MKMMEIIFLIIFQLINQTTIDLNNDKKLVLIILIQKIVI